MTVSKPTRLYLTSTELQTKVGRELLDLTVRIATDGKLDLEEIKELRKWLKLNEVSELPSVAFLHDIMTRITADKLIDRDELIELHLAIERVIPKANRDPIIKARKTRDAARKERLKEQLIIQREKERAEAKKQQAIEYARYMRLRHAFAKVAGVTFPNDNGTERQAVLRRCVANEQLILRHDAYNEYSMYAIQVLRKTGEQLGHTPEYMAERIYNEVHEGYGVTAVLLEVTGGTSEKPTLGANIAIFFIAKGVDDAELSQYIVVSRRFKRGQL